MNKQNQNGRGTGWQAARLGIAVMGALIGTGIVAGAAAILAWVRPEFTASLSPLLVVGSYVLGAVLCGILFFFLAPAFIRILQRFIAFVESYLGEIPMPDIISGAVGLIVGLLIAYLLSTLVRLIQVPVVVAALSAVLYVVLGVLGWSIGRKRRGELRLPDIGRRREREPREKGKPAVRAPRPKVLDTSVIIDGRIFDICKTGIIEGTLVIPQFVLGELRHVSDSVDGLKRNRGRRGLDVLNKIQKELDVPVRVEDKDYDDIAEVDAKLIRLAQDLGGVVVTNDFNLNKVAVVQNVPVLNINELANAVKPVVLPGEEMTVNIIKDGKEPGQGVAYLDDGTMIVVDGGRRFLGETKDVVVTSVLQTAAGRMIFSKIA